MPPSVRLRLVPRKGPEEHEGVVVEAELLEIIEKAGDVAVAAGPGLSGVGGISMPSPESRPSSLLAWGMVEAK